MTIFLRHKFRGSPDYQEDLWDDGGREKSKSGSYIGGGFFRTNKNGTKWGSSKGTFSTYDGALVYPDHTIVANTPDVYSIPGWFSRPTFQINGDTGLESLGAEAWNRMRPDKPDMSILNAVYELRELPQILKPRILKHRDTKAWSDYYLAIQFGWLPTLHDIQDFVKNTILCRDRIDQLIRDEGKPVHRARKLANHDVQDSGTISGSSYGAFLDGMVTQVHNGIPSYTDSFSTGIETWCVGQYQFWLPPGPRDWRWHTKQVLRVFGSYPSPAVVWNAVPWSWLIDWFSNAGDVLENIDFTVVDRLSANYAFLMQRRYYTASRTSSGSYFTPGGGTVDVNATTILTNESKNRTVIDPFGPSVGMDNMSNTQAAILGALGMSRMPSSR